MTVTLIPERISYVIDVERWVLNIGPYHLWFDTQEEATDYWVKYQTMILESKGD